MTKLKEVTSRALAGGGVAIESPLWRSGEHGDLVSALVLALWRAYKLGWEDVEKTPDDLAREQCDSIELEFMAQMAEQNERMERFERLTGMGRR